VTKWKIARIGHLVLADIADESVRHAISRYNQMRPSFTASFICANCHLPGLQRELQALPYYFDFVSCQFALHYSFESQETAEQLLKNISCKLRPGGYFIGTIPSANRIVDRVLKSPDKRRFGNEYYSVEFEDDSCKFPHYGAKYTFELQDAIEGVPEFLVHWETLVALAAKHHLKLERKANFSDFMTESTHETKQLLARMRNGDNSPIEDKFWEIINLYTAFVFQKEGENTGNTKSTAVPDQSRRFQKVDVADINIVND